MSDLYLGYIRALRSTSSPALFLDQASFQKNINWVVQNCRNKKIRIATKSLRSVEIIKRILASHDCFQGLMTYTLDESLWLREQGLEDILMGYPTTDKRALEELAKNPKGIVLMVDRTEHLELLEEIASQHQTKFEICVDLDLSLDLPGIRFGVYRSSIQQADALEKFLDKLKSCSHLRLVGAMGYEAQIAGVADKTSFLLRTLKKLSLPQLQKRRMSLIEIIQKHGHTLKIVNGGGTGSLTHTSQELVVTEITVGSAFYAPVLFDHYQEFKLSPALMFTAPIVRQPAQDLYTILGGGYIASGEVGPIKQPEVYLPQGLSFLKHEGAGEVQTPLRYQGRIPLKIGDSVILRHAKAGEICERFQQIHIIDQEMITTSVNTYRGDGKCFL